MGNPQLLSMAYSFICLLAAVYRINWCWWLHIFRGSTLEFTGSWLFMMIQLVWKNSFSNPSKSLCDWLPAPSNNPLHCLLLTCLHPFLQHPNPCKWTHIVFPRRRVNAVSTRECACIVGSQGLLFLHTMCVLPGRWWVQFNLQPSAAISNLPHTNVIVMSGAISVSAKALINSGAAGNVISYKLLSELRHSRQRNQQTIMIHNSRWARLHLSSLPHMTQIPQQEGGHQTSHSLAIRLRHWTATWGCPFQRMICRSRNRSPLRITSQRGVPSYAVWTG